jgi:hypothetical protein
VERVTGGDEEDCGEDGTPEDCEAVLEDWPIYVGAAGEEEGVSKRSGGKADKKEERKEPRRGTESQRV